MVNEYSKWLLEGHFLKVYDPATRKSVYYFVTQREYADYVHIWSTTIAKAADSGPENLENLKPLATGRLYQTIFGVDVSVFVYVDFPQGTRRWGTDKKPTASSSNWEIGWIDNKKSHFDFPSFITEMFLAKGGTFEYPHIYAYNPKNKTLKPKLHFIQNRLELEEVTEEETLDKLDKKLIPYRFVTLGGIPATRTGAGS